MPYIEWTTEDYGGSINNILSFQIVPTDSDSTLVLLRVAILMQMRTYQNHNIKEDEASVGRNAALDVHIGDRQMKCIQPIDVDLRKVRILDDAEGQGAKLKDTIQRIDILGYIQGLYGLMTDPEISNRVRNNLQLDDYISETKLIKYAASFEKKDEHATNMIYLAPKAENF